MNQPTRQNAIEFAECPTCNHHAEFQYLGTQELAPEIAKATGLPENMAIWQCCRCGTGLLEPNLRFLTQQAYSSASV